ncbi:YhcN/YlaJ family sporulation lipoprotein [Siminovitchia sp. 179-K 8D1 HS]|uniref:YhcN/YlaJ family sporulation lipoprotein n=1 Tax=Siminovitchia sp. 179-K 8D1 HS TaxID=3142385 RepID=UPI0039A21231
MKLLKPIIGAGLVSLMLVGCGTNNDNDRFTSDDNRPLGVRYNPQDNRDGVDNNMNDGLGVNNNGNNGAGNNNRNNANNNNDQNIDVADDVADRIARLDEVERAYVLVTNGNAYVAVKLTDRSNNNLTRSMERKIAREAREANKQIVNVYVSENPDFYDRMRGYRNDINNGRPVSGFFDEFTETVRRVFPTAR